MKITYKFYFMHYRFMVLLTMLSFFVYWWGWSNSLQKDGMPFSRSGAIATAILLTYLVTNYPEKLAQVMKDIANALENSGNWTSASQNIRAKSISNIKPILDRTISIIQYWYMLLMLIATLIWGLGDRFYVLANDPSISKFELAIKLISLQSN